MLKYPLMFDGEVSEIFDVKFEIEKYSNNNRLAILLYCFDEDGFEEPFGDVTVNLSAPITDKRTCGYLDTNNLRNVGEWLIENGFGEMTGKYARSGWCTYPEFRFNLEEIEKHTI